MNVRYFRLLSYFGEVAKAGSVRGAAAKLSLSPAVVSAALFDLEDILGTTLFRRSTRRMDLTHDGQIFLDKAVVAIDAFEAVFDDVNDAEDKIEGRVSITLPSELAAAWVPTVISTFIEKHPQIDLRVHAEDTKINAAESAHDIALRTEFQPTPRLHRNGVAAYPLELVCAPSLADGLSGSLSRDLNHIGFISSEHQMQDGQLYCVEKETLRDAPLPINPTFSIDNRQVVLDLARQGFGAALLLSISVESDLASGALLRVNSNYAFGFVMVRTIMLDKRPSRAARAFRDFVTKTHSRAMPNS